MEYLLIAASVAASSARSIVSKKLSSASVKLESFGKINAVMSFCAFAVVAIYACVVGLWKISALTLILSVLYAIFTVFSQLFLMRALNCGEVSAVTFFYSCGFIIPTLAGTFIWHENFSLTKIIGVLLLVTAFFLCARKNSGTKSRKKSWVLFALIAMVSSGIVGLIQKLHQSSEGENELGMFLISAFAVCTLISVSIALIFGRNKPKTVGRAEITPSLVCGICVGAANIVNLKLSGVIPALIFYPAVNGGVVIVSTLAARIFIGEKINRAGIIGLAIGIIAIALIAL